MQGDVWDIDREHCVPVSWSFLMYKAATHDGGLVKGLNGVSKLQNCPFAWRHVKYYSLVYHDCLCVIGWMSHGKFI